MRISDWSSDVCSSDLAERRLARLNGRIEEITAEEARLSERTEAVAETESANAEVEARQLAIEEARELLEMTEAEQTGKVDAARQAYETIEAEQDRRSEEHTSELQSLMRNSYAVLCLQNTNKPSHPQSTAPGKTKKTISS